VLEDQLLSPLPRRTKSGSENDQSAGETRAAVCSLNEHRIKS
jgi:hypothetical protein